MELVPSKPRVEQWRRLFTRYVFLFLGLEAGGRADGMFFWQAGKRAGGRAGRTGSGQDRGYGQTFLWQGGNGRARLGLVLLLGLDSISSVLYGGILFWM